MKLKAMLLRRAIALVLAAGAMTRVFAQLVELPREEPRLPEPSDGPGRPERMTFFPTPVPVFGAPIGDRGTNFGGVKFNGRAIVPPEELADYVNESFYPALGTRLYEKRLRKPLAQRLADYRAHRDALVNELQNELITVQAVDAADRERRLRAFAQEQTPRIAALENEAEGLRHALVAVDGFLGWGADWNAEREWKLGARPGSPGAPRSSPMTPPGSPEFQVIRAAAYFQNGLGIEQRGLLREIALTQQDKLRASRHQRVMRDALAIFFSPATATLPLAPALPAALRTKIGTYTADKDALKQELHDAIVDLDNTSDAKRTKALHELSERQWPRLVTLENLAEEIRRGLAALPPPPLPPLPPALPDALKERIEAFDRERQALEQARLQNLRAASEKILPRDPRGAEAVVRQDQIFRLENAARYEALAQTGKAIVRDLTAFAGTQINPATGKPVDPRILLRQFDLANRGFAQIGLEEAVYPDYRTAMLEPGLSPEQRRLLFGRALVELAQPLATGTPMPYRDYVPPVPF